LASGVGGWVRIGLGLWSCRRGALALAPAALLAAALSLTVFGALQAKAADQAPAEKNVATAPEGSAQVLIREVRDYLAQGDIGAAGVALKLLLRKAPRSAAGLLLLADLNLLLQRGAIAEVALEQAVAEGIPRTEVLTRLADAYIQQGQAQRVLDELTPPADNPTAAAVLAHQARAWVQLGPRVKARTLLDRALALDADNPLALTDLGRLALSQGRRDEAKPTLERVITTHLDAHEARAVLAETEQAEGRFAEAEGHLDEALALAPERWLYRWQRAMVRIALGKLTAARQDLDAVADVLPGFAGLNLGRARLALAEDASI